MPDYSKCSLEGAPSGSFVQLLCFLGLVRTDTLPCNCRERNLGRHKISEWCAFAGEMGNRAGTLLGAVRLYLGHLFSTGQLNDDTSDEMRRGLRFPIYCFITWMTNGIDFKAKGRQITNGVRAPGSWLMVLLGEAKAMEVPDIMYPFAALATALSLLGTASRDRLVPLTQAYTAHCHRPLIPMLPHPRPHAHSHPTLAASLTPTPADAAGEGR